MTSCHFILRTDASEETGMGHFYRCLTLAKKIEQVGYNSHFVFKYVSERVIEILKQESISFEIIPEGISWEEEILILDKSASQYHLRIVILDNAHLKTFSQLEGFSEYTSSLGEIFKGRVLIDGYKQNSFVGAGINLDLDLIITPYHGEVPSTGHLSNVKFLFGTEYFVFHDDFCRLYNQKKRISEKASKVLVTFGGSDPFSITPHVLEGISSITDRKLEIRVVIGPCFSKSLKEIIRSTITGN